MKYNTLEHHGVEIYKAILGEKKEDNLLKHFCPWECGDNLQLAYTTCTEDEFMCHKKNKLKETILPMILSVLIYGLYGSVEKNNDF